MAQNKRKVILMAQKRIPKSVTAQIRNYARTLREDNLPISRMVLFGSYAKGTQRRYSDIDLCVISSRFRDSFEALQYLWRKKGREHINIEPVGFSPKDFREGSSLINEIKRHGIRVKV